jgi:hypothetical protein
MEGLAACTHDGGASDLIAPAKKFIASALNIGPDFNHAKM